MSGNMINVIKPFLTINSVSVSGSQVVIGSVSTVQYVNDIACQFIWSGSVVANFFVQSSINYNAGTPQSGGQANAGNWDSIVFSGTPTTSSGSSCTVNASGLANAYIRTVAVVSSGSGFISAYLSGKSAG